MSALNSLKLVESRKNTRLSPIVQRRYKLVNKLHEQLELCEARRAGQSYAPKKIKTIKNPATGETATVEVAKRVKEWFWTNDAGRINLAVKYGSQVLTFAKGKNAIEVANADDLISALKTLKDAVLAGELDTQIEAASGALKAGFVK
jgi:hypothetical protein